MKAKFYKNFQIAKCFLFAFFIFHFSFFIFGCSSSSEISKGDLTGSVYLDGSDDHTGISVALYDLAYLDTTIVRINHEYPHIGVIINQHTEFDHRLQSPIKTTTTEADGSFELKDIPTGTYNFVAQKEGFGFRYLYEISISEGDNEISSMYNEQCIMNNAKANIISTEHYDEALAMTERSESAGKERLNASSKSRSEQDHYSSFIIHSSLKTRSDISLYPEIHISGDWISDITVQPYHHLVIDDDTNFVPGTSLTIMPDAVVRINPGCDLKIFGNFSAQGEEGHIIRVLSNGLGNFSSIELNSNVNITTLGYLLIKEAIQALIVNVDNLTITNSIIRDCNGGIVVNHEGCKNEQLLLTNIGDIGLITFNNCEINKGIFINIFEAIRTMECDPLIENNYFSFNNLSVRSLYGEPIIKNNYFVACNSNIIPCASTPIVEYNDFFNNDINIEFNNHYVGGTYHECVSKNKIQYNNFYNSSTCVSLRGSNAIYGGGLGVEEDVITNYNYWEYWGDEETIIDAEDNENLVYYVITNRSLYPNSTGGIQQ